MQRRYIDGLIALVVLMGWVLACSSSERDAAETAKTPPAAVVMADELFNAYKANEVAADQRFKGKVISVTGNVQSIGKDILDNPYLTIGAGTMSEFESVQASFPKESGSALAAISKGQKVTVICKANGKLMNVLLGECSIGR